MSENLGDYQAIVVGAGIVGASVAYHLARRGMTKVLLVDKHGVASGATGRSGGISRTHLPHPAMVTMARAGALAYGRFFQDMEEPISYDRNGAIFLVPPSDLAAARSVTASQQVAGVHVEMISHEDAEALVPGLNLEGVAAVVHEMDAGHADPSRVAACYADTARQLGVTLRTVAVTGLITEDGRMAGVITDKGEARAPVVINAAGAWGARLAGKAGIDLPVRPALRQVVIVVPAGQYGPERPSVYALDTLTYSRPEGMMMMLGGGRRELADVLTGEADPDDPPALADEEFVMGAVAGMIQRMPGQTDAEVGGSWAGVDGTTPDFMPILGEAKELPGLYHACGMSGHGFKLAPAVGEAIAELVITGTCTTYDLTPFAPDRFAGGSPPQAPAYAAGLLP